MNRHLAPTVWDAAFGAAHADAMKRYSSADPVALEHATAFATQQAVRLADLAAAEASRLEGFRLSRIRALPGNPDALDRAGGE